MIDMRVVERFVKPLYDARDKAHNYSHIQRMLKTVKELSSEKDVNKELMLLTVYFHGRTKRYRKEIWFFLRQHGFSEIQVAEVFESVERSRTEPKTTEERLAWDANLIDALGAVGIARAFIMAGAKDTSMEDTRAIALSNANRQLLTKEGKKLSRERVLYSKEFLRIMKKELKA
ncbi:MAG: hypothetical protein JW834_02955 [Candidatus Diapherotrites archaeon]|nr:hypothetical protein [Candidatus Diapherotrites archaeon]